MSHQTFIFRASADVLIDEFISSIESDQHLVRLLGVKERNKRGGGLRSRSESDYLECYKNRLLKKISLYDEEKHRKSLERLKMALAIIEYISLKKELAVLDGNLSEHIARCKRTVRHIIIQFSIEELQGKLDVA